MRDEDGDEVDREDEGAVSLLVGTDPDAGPAGTTFGPGRLSAPVGAA